MKVFKMELKIAVSDLTVLQKQICGALWNEMCAILEQVYRFLE